MASPEAYTLLELNQYIRRVVALNFDQPIWMECEIGQAGSSRGHWYLDLVQKVGDTIVAQAQAALWANVYFFLKKKYNLAPEEILRQGMAVKLKVNIDYHERYGLKFIIEDIDTSYTIGALELQRQAILKEIMDKDLVRKNAQTSLPPVIQRLAVISASRAAGYADFMKHIEENPYAFDIDITLFESVMQGQSVEKEMLAALKLVEQQAADFDAVAILRGGGGRTELAVFDNLPLALRIAHYPIPVLVGIGHEIDQSVLDIVAHSSVKTPTALAEFVIQHNADFLTRLDELGELLHEEVEALLDAEWRHLEELSRQLRQLTLQRVWNEAQRFIQMKSQIRQAVNHTIHSHNRKLESIERLVMALHPDQVLQRGYTITSQAGKAIKKAEDVNKELPLKTIFIDGEIQSTVK